MADFEITHAAAIPDTTASAERIAAFLRAAYGWMCGGLAITAATAWFVASSPTLLTTIARSGPLYIGLIIAQLGIVFYLSARVQRLSAPTMAYDSVAPAEVIRAIDFSRCASYAASPVKTITPMKLVTN